MRRRASRQGERGSRLRERASRLAAGWRRVGRRWRRLGTLALAVGVGASGLGLVAGYLVEGAAAGRVYGDVAALPKRYAIIVLGAYVDGAAPSDALAGRLAAALRVYRGGRGRRFLVSGDHGRSDYDEANAMRSWLLARGVPARDVFMDHAGFRTLDTMARARQVFEVTDAVVVTQAYHLPRALYLAKAMGIDAVGMAADGAVYEPSPHDRLREFVARAVALVDVLCGREPRFLGPQLPLTGDAALTVDQPE